MLSKVKKEKFINVILFKYFINIIVAPIVTGVISFIVVFPTAYFREGGWERFFQEWFKEPMFMFGIHFKNGYCLWVACVAFIGFITNVFSVVPFIKLIIDKIQNAEEEKVIEVIDKIPCYEVNGMQKTQGFVVDTLARREAVEMLIKDKNKIKYRLFWDERFGEDKVSFHTQKTRIKYFKHSRIIFFYEDIPDEPNEQPEQQ